MNLGCLVGKPLIVYIYAVKTVEDSSGNFFSFGNLRLRLKIEQDKKYKQ